MYKKQNKAFIHSIDSLSNVDGPGTRFVVFMQGCNLRCKFCHNPDTWEINNGKLISSDELYKKINNARIFFEKLNGGVTFTGGDPLVQIDFLIEMCKKLKENNIHVTIDTAGYFDINNKIKELLRYVDLVMLDIKHIDNEKHKWLTGKDNVKILNFAKYLSDNNIKTRIRIVYMPGITDEREEHIIGLKNFISNLKSLEKVEVLPYHTMGISKWNELGIEYKLRELNPPTDIQIKELKSKLNID